MSSIRGRDRAIGAYCATSPGMLMHRSKWTGSGRRAACLASAHVKRLFGIAALILAISSPVQAVEVNGDDLADRYVISGAVLLNDSSPEAPSAAVCTNCHWRIIRICLGGTLEDRPTCPDAPCAAASEVAELWRADAAFLPPVGDPLWEYHGILCLSDPPVAAAGVTSAVADLAHRSLPPLAPRAQPSGVTLTGLPTYFRAGQPSSFAPESVSVAGVAVRLRARPTWTWDFGHGPILVTEDPGGPAPTGSIRHTYPRRGVVRVRVTCVWTAVYSAHGIQDIPVPGEITQSAWFDLRVREARGFLR